jgi:hypothetical protein
LSKWQKQHAINTMQLSLFDLHKKIKGLGKNQPLNLFLNTKGEKNKQQ